MRAGDRWVGNAAAGEPVTATVLLKPAKDISEQLLSGNYHPASRESAERDLAAGDADVSAVRQFAANHGLTVQSVDNDGRRVVLSGDAQHMGQAFGIELGQVQDSAGHTFRSYKGNLTLPPEISGAVTAVLGLDQRPVARHANTGPQ